MTTAREPARPSDLPMPEHTSLHRLSVVARRQFGVASIEQLRAAGLSASTVAAWCERGLLVRRERGVYALTVVPDSREARWLVALLAAGPDAALSHRTAASLHGVDHRLPLDEIHLVAPRRRERVRPGLVLHESRGLAATEVVDRGPFRVTTLSRTLCDLAGDLASVQELRRVVASAVRSGATDVRRLERSIERRRRFPGRTALRRVVRELSPLEPLAREELESRFLSLTTAAGLAPTALNFHVVDGQGRHRYLDAVWLPERVYAELDSRSFHGTLVDWHDDLRRENAVAIAGWRLCLRFSWWDVVEHPDEVIATLEAALESVRH